MKNPQIPGLNKLFIRFFLEKLFGMYDAKTNQIKVNDDGTWISPRIEVRIKSVNKFKLEALSSASEKLRKLHEETLFHVRELSYIQEGRKYNLENTDNNFLINRIKKEASLKIKSECEKLDSIKTSVFDIVDGYHILVASTNMILNMHLARYYSGIVFANINKDIVIERQVTDNLYIVNFEEYNNFLRLKEEIINMIDEVKEVDYYE